MSFRERGERTVAKIALASIAAGAAWLFVPGVNEQNTPDTKSDTTSQGLNVSGVENVTPAEIFDRSRIKDLADVAYSKVNPSGEPTGNPYLIDIQGNRWALYSSEIGNNHLENSYMQVFITQASSGEMSRYSISRDGSVQIMDQEYTEEGNTANTLDETEMVDFYNRFQSAVTTGTVPLTSSSIGE